MLFRDLRAKIHFSDCGTSRTIFIIWRGIFMKKKALVAAVLGLALSVSATAMASTTMTATGMSGLSPLADRPEDHWQKMLPKNTYKLASVHQVEIRLDLAVHLHGSVLVARNIKPKTGRYRI